MPVLVPNLPQLFPKQNNYLPLRRGHDDNTDVGIPEYLVFCTKIGFWRRLLSKYIYFIFYIKKCR